MSDFHDFSLSGIFILQELSQTLHEVKLELQVAMSLKHPSVNELLGVVAHFPGPGRSHKDWSIGLVFEL
jgi:hypothetical protein